MSKNNYQIGQELVCIHSHEYEYEYDSTPESSFVMPEGVFGEITEVTRNGLTLRFESRWHEAWTMNVSLREAGDLWEVVP